MFFFSTPLHPNLMELDVIHILIGKTGCYQSGNTATDAIDHKMFHRMVYN